MNLILSDMHYSLWLPINIRISLIAWNKVVIAKKSCLIMDFFFFANLYKLYCLAVVFSYLSPILNGGKLKSI